MVAINFHYKLSSEYVEQEILHTGKCDAHRHYSITFAATDLNLRKRLLSGTIGSSNLVDSQHNFRIELSEITLDKPIESMGQLVDAIALQERAFGKIVQRFKQAIQESIDSGKFTAVDYNLWYKLKACKLIPPELEARYKQVWLNDFQALIDQGITTIDNSEQTRQVNDGCSMWRTTDEYSQLKAQVQANHQSKLKLMEAERIAEEEVEEAERQKIRDAEDRAALAKMLETSKWIEAHGSERLKTGYDAGYDMQKLYITERANQDYPGYQMIDGGSALGDRTDSPTLEALHLESSLELQPDMKSSINTINRAYLPGGPSHYQTAEAIVLTGYLGEYNLALIVEPAPTTDPDLEETISTLIEDDD
jgi:hypothetical protein